MDAEALTEGTLRSYLRILTNRKWSVIVVFALTLATTFLYTHRQATIYQSSAQLLLAPTATQQVVQGMSFQYSQPSVPDQVQVLEGNGVASVVEKKLHTVPGISGSELGSTDVMLVTASANTAKEAALVANTYAEAYMSYENQTVVANLMASNKTIESQLATVQTQLSNLQDQLATATKNSDTAKVTTLQGQITSLQSQQNVLGQEVTQISQAAQLGVTGTQEIATAVPPSSPTQPNLKRNLLFGLIAGLILGIAFVVAREYFDDTIRSEEELHLSLARSEKTAHVLVLGAIPFGHEVIPGEGGGVVSIVEPSSPQAEAYRELRTSLQFLQVREPIQVVLISSPSGGEGKSTTIANLGVMLARTGKSVVVLSCDLRRPRLYEYFGISSDVGFTSVLVGDSSLDEALCEIPEMEGLYLMPTGPLPPNPAELLSSPAAEELIGELKERFDVVLIDSPPVLRVTDAAVLSTLSDTTLIVVRSGLTTRRDMVKSLDTFKQIGSPVAGIVVNALPSELTYKDRYYYGAYGVYGAYAAHGARNGNGKPTNGKGGGQPVPIPIPVMAAETSAETSSETAAGSAADEIPAPDERARYLDVMNEVDEGTRADPLPRTRTERLTFADDDPVTAPQPESPPPAAPKKKRRPVPDGGGPPRGAQRPAVPPNRRTGFSAWLLGPQKKPKRPPST